MLNLRMQEGELADVVIYLPPAKQRFAGDD